MTTSRERGPDTSRGLSAKCSECGHQGILWIDDETFAALVKNAGEKSAEFKATLAKAALCDRMAEALNLVMEALETDSPAICEGTETYRKYMKACEVIAAYDSIKGGGKT